MRGLAVGPLLSFTLGAACIAASIGVATAQLSVGVVARVNSELITEVELEQRTRLALVSSRIGDSPANRNRARRPILDQLIDERLRLREALRNGLTVSPDEIDSFVGQAAAAQGIEPGKWRQTLLAAGIDPAYAEDQIKSSIAWMKLVEVRLRPQSAINEQEIADARNRLGSVTELHRKQLAEIFLAVDMADTDGGKRADIDWLLESIGAGASYAVAAQHFSQAASAVGAGEVGCMPWGLLEPAIGEAIARLGERKVSDPIRSADGWHIVRVRGDSTGWCSREPDDPHVHVVQMLLPLPADAPLEEVERQAAEARAAMAQVRVCSDLYATARRIKGARTNDVESVRPGLLPRHIRESLTTSPLGTALGPYRLPDAVQVLAICRRSGSNDPAVRHEEIAAALRTLKLDKAARQYMRDLRRSAIIEVGKL